MQLNWVYTGLDLIHLKNFLHKQGVSHRLFLTLRNQNHLQVNHHIQRSNLKLQHDDVVTVTLPNEESDPQVAVSDQPIEIEYEDQNWLVVNKPAGLTSVPGPSNRTDTLVNRIKGHLVQSASENLRPHLITRLDRYTSGLILVAKNQLANSVAVQMSQQHRIDKQYLAVVTGKIKRDHWIIDRPIGRVGDQIRRQVIGSGQAAKTEYWVLNRLDNATVLKLKLHTGRTHQIRVHLASIGHPLIGDGLYDGPQFDGVDHQLLDAHVLKFHDQFNAQDLAFKTVIPEKIRTFMEGEHH